jgi:hypothetical protein
VNRTLNKSELFDVIVLTNQNKRNQRKSKTQKTTKNQRKSKKKKQEPYVSRTDQNSIKKEKLRQDNGMEIQKCSSNTMSIWLNDLPSWEFLSLNRKNSDLHSIKSATINYNLGLIIESYLYYDYTNIYSCFLDINNKHTHIHTHMETNDSNEKDYTNNLN